MIVLVLVLVLDFSSFDYEDEEEDEDESAGWLILFGSVFFQTTARPRSVLYVNERARATSNPRRPSPMIKGLRATRSRYTSR